MSWRTLLSAPLSLLATVLAALEWRVERLARLAAGDVRPDFQASAPFAECEVVAYFGDDPSRLYQLQQWLPPLERLSRERGVAVLVRNYKTYLQVVRETSLPVLFARRLRDLDELMAPRPFRAAIYVNNSTYNFQLLVFPHLVHIHVNHGESDKVSMASNQVKAYDQVFVAGPAAVDRYLRNLADFDERKLVQVGRPQLDAVPPSPVPPSQRPTVLYAPTWEGERDSMNYTSLDVYGQTLVTRLLDGGRFRLLYKPHPRVDRGTTEQAHRAILAALAAANQSDPAAGHRVEMDAPILSLFEVCDVMITDVSSVALDFLYLATGKPVLLTDRRNDPQALADATALAKAATVVDASNVDDVAELVGRVLENDDDADARAAMRRRYFGDLSPGESTERFLEAVRDAVEARAAAVGPDAAIEAEVGA